MPRDCLHYCLTSGTGPQRVSKECSSLGVVEDNVLYTVHCTLYTVNCTLYTVHCTPYSVHCTLFTLHSTLYSVHFTLYTVQKWDI